MLHSGTLVRDISPGTDTRSASDNTNNTAAAVDDDRSRVSGSRQGIIVFVENDQLRDVLDVVVKVPARVGKNVIGTAYC